MKRNKAKGLILSLFLVIMLLAGFGKVTAQAQYRTRIVQTQRPVVVYRNRPAFGPRWGWGWNDPFWNRTITVVDPIAQQKESGYSDVYSRGKDDAMNNHPVAAASHKYYRNCNQFTVRIVIEQQQ